MDYLAERAACWTTTQASPTCRLGDVPERVRTGLRAAGDPRRRRRRASTYGDFAERREVHDDGEIWAQTLWYAARRRSGGERPRARCVTDGLRLVAARAVVPRHAQRDPARATARSDDRGRSGRCSPRAAWATSPRPTAASDDTPPTTTSTRTARRAIVELGTLTGRVRDEDGAPRRGRARRHRGPRQRAPAASGPPLAPTTDADGRYALAAPGGQLPAISRAARPRTREPRAEDVTSPTAAPADVDFTLAARLVLGRQRRVGRALHRAGQHAPAAAGPGGLIDDAGGHGLGHERDGGGQRDRDRPRRARRRRARSAIDPGRRLRRRPDAPRSARLRGARLDRAPRRARARSLRRHVPTATPAAAAGPL